MAVDLHPSIAVDKHYFLNSTVNRLLFLEAVALQEIATFDGAVIRLITVLNFACFYLAVKDKFSGIRITLNLDRLIRFRTSA